MITPDMLEAFMEVDIAAAGREELVDINTLEFDNSLSREQRRQYILEQLSNPYCFRCGEMGVKLEFEDGSAPLQEVLTGFLIRKKNGL